MNRITVKNLPTPYRYNDDYLVIDGVPITECIPKYKNNDKKSDDLEDLRGLYPAWGKELIYEGEKIFIRTLLQSEEREVIPILVCPDDLDLSCTVIVADVRKDDGFVYWDRIGWVSHKNFKTDNEYGISYLEAYTYEDWEKYGDNIALEEVGSREWREWISENWTEECYRRCMNYTRNYYKQPENINWLYEPHWVFDREEYEACVSFYNKQ